MAFWGVEVKPGKPYTLEADNNSKGRLHLSQATLGSGDAIKKSIVQCNIGNKSPIYLCSLFPEKSESCQLNLEFHESVNVIFSVVGPRSVHLSGFFLPSSRTNLLNDDDHSESYGQDIGDTETERSADDEDDYEYSDSFIDDGDVKVASRSPSVSFDRDERKHRSRRRIKKTYRVSESDDDSTVKSNTTAKGNTDVMALDEDDKCPISSLSKSKHSIKTKVCKPNENEMNGKEKSKAESKAEKSVSDVDDFFSGIALELAKTPKRSKEADLDLQGQSNNPAIKHEEPGLPLASSGVVTGITERPKKKRKHMKQESTQEVDSTKAHNVGERMPVDNEGNHNDQLDVGKKKEKKKIKNQFEENGEALNSATTLAIAGKTNGLDPDNGKDDASSHVISLPSGIVQEDILEGSPSGKIAAPGKKISIRYTATVEESGEVFGSNVDGDLLKFRLGKKGTSDVWNVGLQGMRVGGKRRLFVPPSMSLGIEADAAKNGSPNSMLVLEVELLKVR